MLVVYCFDTLRNMRDLLPLKTSLLRAEPLTLLVCKNPLDLSGSQACQQLRWSLTCAGASFYFEVFAHRYVAALGLPRKPLSKQTSKVSAAGP